jgi:tRNA (cmo5U34)-methyltransferase
MKSTVEQIRARFDAEVDRFSNLETGQTATMDAPLALELVAAAAAASTPKAQRLLDVGCGAGNYTLKLLERLPGLEATLIDLSRPMLERADVRVRAAGAAKVSLLQNDVRLVDLGTQTFDIMLASAVLHHLRTDAEWESVFTSFFRALAPGGSLWVFDLVAGASPELEALAWRRYGEYLVGLGGAEYRDRVYAYIEKEDTPRPLFYQLDLLRRAGFAQIEVLHKHACFAAYGGVKS